MNKRILYKLEKIILILIFFLSIYTPFIAGIIQEDKTASGIEKRNLAQRPLLPTSFNSIGDYLEKFNSYYSDHFGYREVFIKLYFKLINKLGNKASVHDVTIGQNGWLFLGSIKRGYHDHGDPIGDAINADLFTKHALEDFAQSIVKINNWLKKRGIKYVYVLAPNKHTIYFEFLPEYISKINDRSSTDQLVSYLRKHTDVAVVDLRPALFDEKKKHQVYFKTDTHWNQYGANVAQYEIMKKIHSFFPTQITPFLLEENQFKVTSRGGGDLASYAKIGGVKEDNPQPIFKTGCIPTNSNPKMMETETHTMTCKTKKLNAIIFRDSFFSAMQPYISRQFHHSTYIWERMNYATLIKYIDKEHPDIVIDEIVERKLPYIPNSKFFDNTD